MITIISPQHYKTIPWKNGQGETTELAINEGGTLDDFNWRLSIASVSENGAFSDFSGYSRHLVFIAGEGITLKHTHHKNGAQIDPLVNLLAMSSFDGGCKTNGELVSGPIKDFNIMTKNGVFSAVVNRYVDQQKVSLSKHVAYFVYCLDKDMLFHVNDLSPPLSNGEIKCENQRLPAQHLLKISAKNNKNITLMGEKMIVVALSKNNNMDELC